MVDLEDRAHWVKAQGFEPRTTLARKDLAEAKLKGVIKSDRFSDTETKTISASFASLQSEPRESAPLLTQGLFGENVSVLEERQGWAFCKLVRDGYVGYMKAKHLSSHGLQPTHVVCVPLSHVYTKPDVKSPAGTPIPFGAQVTVSEGVEEKRFAEVRGLGWIYARHLKPLGHIETDYVQTAALFLNAPYIWGGKTALGLDCSGLLQLALHSAGKECPRDTDQQLETLGRSLGANISVCEKGDVVFFPGHAGFMVDNTRLLHANATHMRVTVDKLERVVSRLSDDHNSPVTDIKRL